jgi:hypothetical protein
VRRRTELGIENRTQVNQSLLIRINPESEVKQETIKVSIDVFMPLYE